MHNYWKNGSMYLDNYELANIIGLIVLDYEDHGHHISHSCVEDKLRNGESFINQYFIQRKFCDGSVSIFKVKKNLLLEQV